MMVDSQKPKNSQSGFTLIELMIAVVVVAILSAIALPSYKRQVQSAHRADAQRQMLQLAQVLERQFTTNASYTTAVMTPMLATVPSGSSGTDIRYRVALITPGNSSYVITATPANEQADDKCATMTLNDAGTKTTTSSLPLRECWKN